MQKLEGVASRSLGLRRKQMSELVAKALIETRLVPAAGLEPARRFRLEILSLLCLPFHHAGMS